MRLNNLRILYYSHIIEPWLVISYNVAFWQENTQTSLCSHFLSLKTPNVAQSAAQHSKNIQATSKGSDQTARMLEISCRGLYFTYFLIINF